MPVQVLIAPCVCGFHLRPEIVNQLFEHHPELFDEPHSAAYMLGEVLGNSQEALAALMVNAVRREDDLFFLNTGAALRTCPWLLALFFAQGSDALVERPGLSLKVVEIPDGVDWYIYSDDDGSEAVHEKHRIWQ